MIPANSTHSGGYSIVPGRRRISRVHNQNRLSGSEHRRHLAGKDDRSPARQWVTCRLLVASRGGRRLGVCYVPGHAEVLPFTEAWMRVVIRKGRAIPSMAWYPALYQGQASAGPQSTNNQVGFSPRNPVLLQGLRSRCEKRAVLTGTRSYLLLFQHSTFAHKLSSHTHSKLQTSFYASFGTTQVVP